MRNNNTHTYEVDMKIKMTVAAYSEKEAKTVALRLMSCTKLATGSPEILAAVAAK